MLYKSPKCNNKDRPAPWMGRVEYPWVSPSVDRYQAPRVDMQLAVRGRVGAWLTSSTQQWRKVTAGIKCTKKIQNDPKIPKDPKRSKKSQFPKDNTNIRNMLFIGIERNWMELNGLRFHWTPLSHTLRHESLLWFVRFFLYIPRGCLRAQLHLERNTTTLPILDTQV